MSRSLYKEVKTGLHLLRRPSITNELLVHTTATMSLPTTFTLNNGKKMPTVGLVSTQKEFGDEEWRMYKHGLYAWLWSIYSLVLLRRMLSEEFHI